MGKVFHTCILVAILSLAVVFIACSRDEDPLPLTRGQLLIRKWVVFQVEDNSTIPPTVNQAGSCGGRRYFVFLEDRTFITESFFKDPNTDACKSNGIETGTYTLTTGEEEILFTGENPPQTYSMSILSLTETELVVSFTTEPEFHYLYQRAEPF